ncbi:MAG: ISAs1 family transposase [Planctomycetota bacterium]
MMTEMHRVVKGHLLRTAQQQWSKLLKDPRHRRGRRWKLSTLLNALWAGVLTAQLNLRQVEALCERLGKRVPDTTLHDLLNRLSAAPLQRQLVRQVREAWRAKELVSDLPFSLVAVDGKCLWSGNWKANKHCQKQHDDDGDGKGERYVFRALRAVAVGRGCALTIGQMPVRSKKAEMSTLVRFVDRLRADYGRSGLLEVISVDAGMTSKANAADLDQRGLGYIMALKGTQPELLAEAQRLLDCGEAPAVTGDWERYRGKRIRRLLYRSSEIAGYHGWKHLREVWRVRQETERNGVIEVEERYFLTNLVPGLTKGDVPLRAVRAHWVIENGSNWTLDTQWKEDSRPWCAPAVEVVGLLRLLAFNVLMRLRSRRLRSEARRAMPWQQILAYVAEVLRDARLDHDTLLASMTTESAGPI